MHGIHEQGLRIGLKSSALVLIGLAFPVLSLAASQPDDNTTLDEVIVTGTKLGAQNLQSTPVAVSVVDSKLLETQGLNTLQDVINYVPNVSFNRFGAAAVVYVRGIGSNSTAAGSDASVTQQVDGVYIARPIGQTGDFLDVDRIEVLRGPQGTLYGRNSVGGTVNIISRRPADTFGGRFRLGVGAIGEKTAEGYLSGPIAGDTVKGSIAATYRNHDGYVKNIAPGSPDLGAANRYGARGQLRFDPSSALDVTLRGDYSKADDIAENFDQLLLPVVFAAPLANSLVGSFTKAAVDVAQTLKVDNGGASVDLNYRFNDQWSFKSISASRSVKSILNNDNDATEIPVQILTSTEKESQFSQEFNLNYQAGKLRAVAGLYYFSDTDSQRQYSVVPVSLGTPAARAVLLDANAKVRTTSYAAFLQGSYALATRVNLIVGARYTSEKKSFDQNFMRTSLNPATLGVSAAGFPVIFSTDRTDHAVTPKLGIDFQATPEVYLYASVTRGFKSGGYNNAATAAATSSFAPELLTSYEAGAKTEYLNRRLRVNVTAFNYDYTDLQVRQFIAVGNAIITNAATAKVSGLEVETLLRATAELQFSANLSYLRARYGRFTSASVSSAYATLIPNQVVVAGVASFDASGKQIEGSPEFSGVIGVDYSPHVGQHLLTTHIDYTYRGSVFYDPSNIAIASQGSYGLINASIGLGLEHGWKLEAYVKNAIDRKYYVTIAGNGLVPGGIAGDPRTYGLRAGVQF